MYIRSLYYWGPLNALSTMSLFYVLSIVCRFMCILPEDDLEAITNSIKCKVRLVCRLQSVPHPMKSAHIMLPHTSHCLKFMKTCWRYGQMCPRFKVQQNDDGCCHLLVFVYCASIKTELLRIDLGGGAEISSKLGWIFFWKRDSILLQHCSKDSVRR